MPRPRAEQYRGQHERSSQPAPSRGMPPDGKHGHEKPGGGPASQDSRRKPQAFSKLRRASHERHDFDPIHSVGEFDAANAVRLHKTQHR